MPSEFLSRATAWDLEVLRVYDSRFLLGDLHDDFRTAMWCQTYINSKLKPSASPLKVTDFMPLYDKPAPQQQSTQQIVAAFKAWARANGADIPPGE